MLWTKVVLGDYKSVSAMGSAPDVSGFKTAVVVYPQLKMF